MLVARRDPPFDAGAHDDRAPLMRRTLSAGRTHSVDPFHDRCCRWSARCWRSRSASPAAIRSITPIFSPKRPAKACAAISSRMLDKNVDASTLRMLVRRDAMAFEKSCGAVDPDAVAAFKTLLTSTRTAAALVRQVAPEPVRKTADAPKTVVAKPVTAKSKSRPQGRNRFGCQTAGRCTRRLIHTRGKRREPAKRRCCAASPRHAQRPWENRVRRFDRRCPRVELQQQNRRPRSDQPGADACPPRIIRVPPAVDPGADAATTCGCRAGCQAARQASQFDLGYSAGRTRWSGTRLGRVACSRLPVGDRAHFRFRLPAARARGLGRGLRELDEKLSSRDFAKAHVVRGRR